MSGPRLLLYILSLVVAVALVFFGAVQMAFIASFADGLLKVGVGLALVLLNSSRPDRA